MTTKIGYFVFSLDTELGWGYFDQDHLRHARFSHDGSQERKSIERLLDTLDEFGIAATWAIVGHMFYESCEHCAVCPILDWKNKYGSFEEVYETKNPLWYGADVINSLLTRRARHEIAFHGYTHEIFDENTMSEEKARIEIREWIRLSRRKNIIPQTVVFPRNKVGHLRLFEEFGFLCYRGEEPTSTAHSLLYLRKIFVRLLRSFFFMPPVYGFCEVGAYALVNIPSSPNYFKHDRWLVRLFDALHLQKLSMSGAIRGIRKAAKESKIIHLRAHPCEFQTEKDWEKLRYLLGYVSKQVRLGKLQSITMADLAKRALKTHTASSACPA
jgi:hypothetical protein